MFTHVSRTDATTGILYERVLPFGNLTHYNSLAGNPDTSNYSHFLRAYNELYRATFQPSITMIPKDTLKQLIENDTTRVQIGMLHFYFNTFDTTVFRDKLYFDSDSVLWEDPFNTNSLYKENVLFIASPLTQVLTTLNAKFTVNSLFYFDNTRELFRNVSIDFNDGLGFRLVGLNEVVRVKYLQDGIKTIKFKVTLRNGDVLLAYATIEVKTEEPEGQRYSGPLYYDDFTGPTAIKAKINLSNPYDGGYFQKRKGEVRIYYANSDKVLRKPLLIIDGFDPLDERKFDTNLVEGQNSLWKMLFYYDDYSQHLHLGLRLLDMGYDVVLLNLPDGGAYIEENALVCIEVINRLNEMLLQNNSDEQIVVVGPSMGGQIARYALTYMEQNLNANTNYGKHNTRLWISYDSPHQGANIAMGAQALIEHFADEDDDDDVSNIWKNKLCCHAALQMLIHHRKDTLQQIYNEYYSHLHNLNTQTNGYPSNTRNIAIANGSLNNIPSGIPYQISYEGLITVPGVYSYDIRTRNVVNSGTGTVFDYTHWILFVPIHKEVAFTNNFGKGSPDVAPGCLYDTYNQINSAVKKKSCNLSITVHNNQYHCFMPITSTLDISGNLNYCTDVSNINLATEGMTPFDSYAGVMDSNMYHVTFNQHLVDYMLNEIETYIVGLREIQLCTRPSYNLHLPQDSVATVTWTSSDNIRILTTNNPYEVSIVPLSTGDGWISAEVSTLKHRKTLAHYPIHIISNDNLTPIVQGTTIQGQSLVIDDERYLTSDTFCVENGKTMTLTGTLHCSSGTRIIVRPGGKLVIDGGVLTSSCANEMWQGIEVVGDRTKHQTASFQGVVELRNEAIIENAHCAIRTGLGDDYWNTTGGIIKADNTHFINNQRAVEFLSYVDTVPGSGALRDNYSYFNKCEFKLDNNNLFGYNDCDFIDHVTLWRVKGVKFKGCSFTNQTNEHYTRKHAIYALDAGITLDSYCSNSQIFLPTGCDCPASYSTYNSFSGFSTAMEVNTSGDQFAVRINHALFNNNETAILIKGNPFTTISRCEVNLQNVPTYTLDNRGLVLDHCSGYKVEDNTFSRTTYYPQQLVSTGIYVNNSGDYVDNFLHLNNFTNMNYGVYVKGNNGDSHYGLQITCSDFDHNGYDIFMSSGSSLKCVQGWTNLGADNDFSNTRISSLYNAGSQFVTYYHSHDVEHVPYNVTSSHISVVDYATANGCESTLCNLGISPITPTPFLLTNFSSMMNNYISAETATQQSNMDGMIDGNSEETLSSTFQTEMSSLIGMRQNFSEIYYESVRALMADSLLNLNELEQWHTVAQPISDPYSLTETRFQNGNANSTVVAETIEETYNYADFHSLKTHCWSGRDGINWYELSNLQIEQLKAIAELNTGRSSVMAKGVLCFIFGICYEDDWSTEEAGETRSAKATPNNNDTSSLVVYPNPTDNLLYVELLNSVIENVLIYDLQGRVVESAMSIKDGFTLINVSTIPAGVYLIRVTDEQGSLYHQKFVKK